MRHRFGLAPVARLATTDGEGRPHLVPITFALVGDTIYTAIDHKPKSTTRLKRLANIRANPSVSILADHYEDDWTRLWWVRVDGRAVVLEEEPERERGIQHLRAKYDQYRRRLPDGPVIAVDIERWSGWEA